MQYLITAYDGENMLDKRLAVRAQHLKNLANVKGKIVCAGGLLDDAGRMKGSMLVMEFDDKKHLDDYLASEPYIQERVWETVNVEPMNIVIVSGEKVGK